VAEFCEHSRVEMGSMKVPDFFRFHNYHIRYRVRLLRMRMRLAQKWEYTFRVLTTWTKVCHSREVGINGYSCGLLSRVAWSQ